MQIKQSDYINGAVLLREPETVMVQAELHISRFKPCLEQPGTGALAGVYLPGGPGQGVILTVEFHGGLSSWVLTEDPIQARPRYHAYPLLHALQALEDRAGVKLPAIKVVEYGKGIYTTHEPDVRNNPWALRDGHLYEVQHPSWGRRQFMADVNNGQTLICFVSLDNPSDVGPALDPAMVLLLEEWKSLKEVPESTPAV